ncbi:MAG: cysteine/glutathione ABC transporter permease/ATP-binding protein CydD [Endozoicomonadaceae bacterium]|nr:cysteine/glutathione ABC transporter permease/ATP-binding protein CydD [Endozoicomonadaceae bacterium]
MDKQKEKQIYQWLKKQAKPAAKWFSLTSLLGIFNGFLMIAQAGLLARIISLIVMHNYTYRQMLNIMIALLIVLIVKACVQWLRELCSFQLGKQVCQQLRKKLLDKIATVGPLGLNQKTTGQWVILIQENISQMHDFYARYLPHLRIMSILPLVTIIIAFCCNWAAGCIFLITTPLIPFFMVIVGNKAAEANRKNFQVLADLGHYFLDRLQGLATLRLLNRSKKESSNIASAAENFRVHTMRVLRLAFLSSAVLEFFASVSVALTAVYLGMTYLDYLNFGTWGQPLTLFIGFFLLLLAPEFYNTFRELGTHYHARAQAIGAGDTVMDFFSTPEIFHRKNQRSFTASSQLLMLTCENLTVKAPDGTVLLNDISFSIQPGEFVTITGPSGGGKSTLIRTLLGFYVYEGSIIIDGQELRDINLQQYHKYVGWLNQSPSLIHGSVADNVRLGVETLDDDAVNEALKQAYATEFVEKMADGIHTPLGENASRLSVGQAQRITLARTLIRKGQLIFLDEPTANLDKKSEQLINDSLQNYKKHCTMLMATHKISQMEAADNILLLDQGKLIASGSLSTLKTTSTLFKALWNTWQTFEHYNQYPPAETKPPAGKFIPLSHEDKS